MFILKLLKSIYYHPLNRDRKIKSIFVFFYWQLLSRLAMGKYILMPFIKDTHLLIRKGQTGATLNIYYGLHEYIDMLFLMHAIRENYLFVDVGSNIGSYTILASAFKKCQSISIEPIPETFDSLKKNILINDCMDRVQLFNVGCSSKPSKLSFTSQKDAANRVTLNSEIESVVVETIPIDQLLPNDKDIIIKIDVEGYEGEVLAGMNDSLQRGNICAIILELNGLSDYYGSKSVNAHTKLLSYNYSAYNYNPYKRKLTLLETHNQTGNTIYILNNKIESIKTNIKECEPILINNLQF